MKKKHFEWMTSFVVVLLSAAMISCSSETDGLEEVESSTSSQINVLLYIVYKEHPTQSHRLFRLSSSSVEVQLYCETAKHYSQIITQI